MVAKSLDIKLARIRADRSCRDFIIADAKDADMAFGISAPGQSPEHHAHEGRFRTQEEYRGCIRAVVRQGLVDIMLMSAHTNAILTIGERLFADSHITPAARANDTTDIFVIRGGIYTRQPALPFRTATIDHIQCGKVECREEERALGADLGLYSVTFNNDAELDRLTLERYREFRIEAEQKGFRHFLEVFDPNAPVHPIPTDRLGGFINDMIVRCLAGVPESGRPLFLKMVYHGPKWTEELARFDPSLVVGVLGGSAGTTYDAFKLISEAQKYGARVALFGRKINNAEHQLAFIEMLRRIVDGQITPEEAVRAYHGVLQGLGIRPYRSLEEDSRLTTAIMSYGGTAVTVPGSGGEPPAAAVSAAARPQTDRSPAAEGSSSAAQSASASSAEPSPPDASPPTRSPRPAGRSSPAKSESASVESPAGQKGGNGVPDFSKLTPQERLVYFRSRLNQM